MNYPDSHFPDEQLLRHLERELSARDEKLVQSHLDVCWKCRARRQELENAIADVVRAYQREFDTKLPPIAGSRALLRARLADVSSSALPRRSSWLAFLTQFAWPLTAGACGLLALGFFLANSGLGRPGKSRPQAVLVSIPDSRLTPGAAVLETRQAVCAQPNTGNKAVPVALQRKVFEEYGIARAEPRAYEVDYLITPALGGADDIHNLWPQSDSSTVWNAHVKDELEDRLRDMVCDGSVELTEAQKEIAENWIAAYKKYFHTDKPLGEHREKRIQ
jgi:hypothetical protein